MIGIFKRILAAVSVSAQAPTPKSDLDWFKEGFCPSCHQPSLVHGPAGGMSLNVGCANCGDEFNTHWSLGAGPIGIERTGKMTDDRARNVFGIDPGSYLA